MNDTIYNSTHLSFIIPNFPLILFDVDYRARNRVNKQLVLIIPARNAVIPETVSSAEVLLAATWGTQFRCKIF